MILYTEFSRLHIKSDMQNILIAGIVSLLHFSSYAQSKNTFKHTFVVCDYHKERIIKVSETGEIVWEYSAMAVHDVWMLKDGNILFAGPNTGVCIVTPEKEIIWKYTGPQGSKIYGCQPLPNGSILVNMESPSVNLIQEVAMDQSIIKEIKTEKATIRLARKTKDNTYLLPNRNVQTIMEYDTDGILIRTMKMPGKRIYLAIRLQNGNTLIACGDGHTLIELDSEDNIVWQVEEDELEGITLSFVGGMQRLPNGNTVFCNWGGHGQIGEQPQIIEITHNKKVVGAIFDNSNYITPLQIQILDTPGDPSKGELIK